MNNIGKKGFSFVEIIISVAILTIISIVATTAYNGMQQKSDNSKIIGDLRSLSNTLESFKEANKDLPQPSGNKSFYKEDTSYSHSYDEAFGVSGFIKEDTLDKKFLAYTPVDPKTNQYYAYARTRQYLSYELAGVVYENDVPTSLVVGNWGGEVGPYNLVKEYSGPNFVYDKSTNYFPYNPYEKKLVAKINSFSGELKVNNKTILDNDLKDLSLVAGDKIFVGTGGSVNLYYSDGSNSILGDSATASELVLANLSFKDNSNLISSIKMVLNVGSIWTKAAKLDTNSEFEIYTPDTVAAVRGTIFGVNKDNNSSSLTVLDGTVKVAKLEQTSDLLSSVQNDTLRETNLSLSGVVETSSGETFIQVLEGGTPKGIDVLSNTTLNAGGLTPTVESSTGMLNQIPTEVKEQVMSGQTVLNENIQTELYSQDLTTSTNKTISIKLKKILTKAPILKINDISYKNWTNSGAISSYLSGNILTLSGNILENKTDIKLEFCNAKRCSKALNVRLDNNISIDYESYMLSKLKSSTLETSSGMLYDLLSDVKITTQTPSILTPVVETNYCFGNNEYCTTNDLSSSGYSLVGYAPYDQADNLKMYLSGSHIGEDQSSVVGNTCVPYYNIQYGYFNNNTCQSSSVTGTNGVGSLPDNYDKDKSFMTWGATKGIFLDNKDQDDYVKYDLSKLDLGNNFALEFSVRGGALKRNVGDTFYDLFALGINGDDFDNNHFYGALKNGGLILAQKETNDATLFNYNIAYELQKFYKLTYFIDNSSDKTKVKLCVNENCSSVVTLNKKYTDLSFLNVGGGNDNKFQWNDIIDYVKVYKKNQTLSTQVYFNDIISNEISKYGISLEAY